ncbi:electron transport complex subunit RsxC [Candidatus Omnitrophota bacterium]
MGIFKGGIHLHYNKKRSLLNPIKKCPLPKTVTIPLSQHLGSPAKPIVKIGDHVHTGTRIGESSGFMSAHVHASISGTVKKIAHYYHPILGFAQAIRIESDEKDIKEKSIYARKVSEAITSEEIREIVAECGIVGLGGAMFPTHIKLSPPKNKPIDTIIINAAECEPYLTCDHMLMLKKSNEIIKGALLIMKAVNAQQCFIAIEDNKMDAYEVIYSKLRGLQLDKYIKPFKLKTKYPHGAEKQQIKTILNREVPLGGVPFEIGVVVQNVATTYAIYEAVYFRKPLYERMITVAGSSLRTSRNLIARVGTSISVLIKECGGYLRQPSKLIMGGPMMGLAQSTELCPIIKGTSGIVVLHETEIDLNDYRDCIRCTKCVIACPMKLIPSKLSILSEYERYTEAKEAGIMGCIECGICSYVCPAKRPMVQFMKIAKAKASQR